MPYFTFLLIVFYVFLHLPITTEVTGIGRFAGAFTVFLRQSGYESNPDSYLDAECTSPNNAHKLSESEFTEF